MTQQPNKEECKCELDGFQGAITSQNCSIHTESKGMEEWEEEFDEKFSEGTYFTGVRRLTDDDPDTVKAFIRQILLSARQEADQRVAEAVRGEREIIKDIITQQMSEVSDGWNDPRRLGAHQALADLSDKIK